MKKTTLIFILTMLNVMLAYADNRTAWVYLNNGSIVKGIATTSDTNVYISTDDGQSLVYPLIEVNRISYDAPALPSVGIDPDLEEITDKDSGFWCSAQMYFGTPFSSWEKSSPWIEGDFVAGYRMDQYLRFGLGIGVKGYVLARGDFKKTRIAIPIYASVRGNYLNDTYRTVVPYSSFDLGGTINEGFMWRPTYGIRVGQSRSAFLLALSYTGQIRKAKNVRTKYESYLSLTLGYEF